MLFAEDEGKCEKIDSTVIAEDSSMKEPISSSDRVEQLERIEAMLVTLYTSLTRSLDSCILPIDNNVIILAQLLLMLM